MATQLDILALEPYYGGVRKQTLELLTKYSRHRWNVYKLPARRLERRLSTAAQWFTQQIQRAPKVHYDVVLVSDAMNLAEFLRLNPKLHHKASIAYFYCNQLAREAGAEQQARLAVLSTASTATEIWFNSFFHMRDFLGYAAATFDAHQELGGKEPLRALVAKSQLMYPPVEIAPPARDADLVDAERKSRTVCFDNREGAVSGIFVEVIREMARRNETVSVHVIGRPLESVPDGVPVTNVDARNDSAVVQALRRCELYVSSHPGDQFDPMAMRAMALGCIPILRKAGVSVEFLPAALHSWCLYETTASELLSRIINLWYLRRPAVARKDLDAIFNRYTPASATKNFDDRLEQVVAQAN